MRAACSVGGRSEAAENLAEGSVDWERLVALADDHRVLPLLHRFLCGRNCVLPPAIVETLKNRSSADLHKTMVLARELLRVYERLSECGIQVLPYKGIPLAEQVYGDMALRQPGDIDLLIRPGDLPRIQQIVSEFGYWPHEKLSAREEQAYLRTGYECAFDSKAGRNVLEVQWAILPRFYAVDLDLAGVFDRAIEVNVAGLSMKTPSLEDQFLLLSIHAAKHVWERLIWIRDIAQMVRRSTLNWEWIKEEAGQLGIMRLLRVTMLLANRLMEMPLPEAFAGSSQEDPEAAAISREVAAQITEGVRVDVESVAYFRQMLRLRERRTDRARFVSRLVFTPGPSEWKAVRLPGALFPLYRVVRLGRLARRFAGL